MTPRVRRASSRSSLRLPRKATPEAKLVCGERGCGARTVCRSVRRGASLPARDALAWRAEQGLTGTKLGCGEGGCGACTVMVSSEADGELWHRSVNACLAPLYSMEGMHVVTVEGARDPGDVACSAGGVGCCVPCGAVRRGGLGARVTVQGAGGGGLRDSLKVVASACAAAALPLPAGHSRLEAGAEQSSA